MPSSSSRWYPLVLSGVEVHKGEISLSSSSVSGDKMVQLSLSLCFLFFTRFLDVDRLVTYFGTYFVNYSMDVGPQQWALLCKYSIHKADV